MRRGPEGGLADLGASLRPAAEAEAPSLELLEDERSRPIAAAGRELLGALLRGHPDAVVEALIDALGAPAFIVAADGALAPLNATGLALLVGERERVEEAVRESLAGRASSFRTLRLAGEAGTHHLAVLRGDPMRSAARLDAVRAAWGLTPKQAEVLALLATGKGNKSIARALDCAEATVELHVTAILAKARCSRRTELVALFWAGG